MTSRNIYVKPAHEAIWRQAEAYADQVGTSLSNLVVLALQRHLAAERRLTTPDTRRTWKRNQRRDASWRSTEAPGTVTQA